MGALIDVDDCPPLPIPADVLVEAARRHLATVDAGEGTSPGMILRDVAGGR